MPVNLKASAIYEQSEFRENKKQCNYLSDQIRKKDMEAHIKDVDKSKKPYVQEKERKWRGSTWVPLLLILKLIKMPGRQFEQS